MYNTWHTYMYSHPTVSDIRLYEMYVSTVYKPCTKFITRIRYIKRNWV